MTGPKPFPKRALHIVGSRASSFKWEYPSPFLNPLKAELNPICPLLALLGAHRILHISRIRVKVISSFPHLLPHLLVTSIPPFIFPSITHCRRQFLHKMWPFQLAFHLLISCRIYLCSLNLSNTSLFLTWSVWMIFSVLLQHHNSKLSRCFWSTDRSVQVSAPYKAML